MRLRRLVGRAAPALMIASALTVTGSGCVDETLRDERVGVVSAAAITDGWSVCAQAFSDFEGNVGTKICEPITTPIDVLWQRGEASLYSISRPWVMRDGYLDGIILFDVVLPPRTGAPDEAYVHALFEQHDRIFTYLPGRQFYGRSLYAARNAALQQYDQLRSAILGNASQVAMDADSTRRECKSILASTRTDPVLTQLAAEKATIARVDDVLAATEVEVTRVGADLAALAARTTELRTGEPARSAEVMALATSGSSSTLATIAGVEQSVRTWGATASRSADALVLDANRAMRRATQAQKNYVMGIYDLRPYLKAHAIAEPVFGVVAARSLGNIAAYGEAYRGWAEDVSARIDAGLHEREEALIEIGTDAATRDTFAQTRFLKASQQFTEEANRRAAALLQLPPYARALRLPLLAGKFDEAVAFLQLEPVCDPTLLAANSWREAGCIALRRSFDRARTFTERTVPVLLRANAAQMRRNGVGDADVRVIESALAAGTVRAAVLQSDAILRARDVAAGGPNAVAGGSSRPAASPFAIAPVAPASVRAVTSAVSPLDEAAQDRCDDLCVLAARVDEVRAELLDALASTRGAASVGASYAQLKAEIAAFLNQPFETRTPGALAAILQRHSDIPQAERDELASVFADLPKDATQLRAEVGAIGASVARRIRNLSDLAEAAARARGFDLEAASSYSLGVSGADVPNVAIPVVPTSVSYDDPADSYVGYADRILAKLAATLDASGAVNDRAGFASIVRAWRTNGAVLAAAFAARAATASVERAAFLRAEGRISAVVRQHMTAADWFIESPVSPATRVFVDGALAQRFPDASRALKDSLHSWLTTTPTYAQGLVDQTVSGLGRAASDPAFDSFDAATKGVVGTALAGALAFTSPRTVQYVRSDFTTLCETLTDIYSCLSVRVLNADERLTGGLALGVTAGQFWRAFGAGATESVGDRLGVVIAGYPVDGDRRALNARVGGLALEALLGTSTPDIAKLADDLGESRVRVFAPLLGAARLGALRDMRFVTLPDAADQALAQRLGAAAKALAPLRGKPASEIRALLRAAGFTEGPTSDHSAEVWFHTDGSVVRLYATGSDALPGRAHVTKEIARSPGTWGPNDIVAAVADVSGATVPTTAAVGRTQLVAWISRPENANRPMGSDEAPELEGYWLYATHPTMAP